MINISVNNNGGLGECPPPCPVLNCEGNFPGSPGWNACVDRFNREMAEYTKQVQASSSMHTAAIHQETMENGVSLMNVNGFSVKTNLRGVSTNTYNGDVFVDARIDGSGVKTTATNESMRFDLEGRNLGESKWVVVSPPPNVPLNSIHHQIRGNYLSIMIQRSSA